MGKGEKAMQMKPDYGSDATLLINILAGIRPLLIDSGLDVGTGIVVFCEDSKETVKIQKNFMDVGAEYVKNVGKSSLKVRNDQIALHFYGKYDREIEIVDFLQNDEFMPIILSGGMMPEFLQEWPNKLIFERDVDIHMPKILRDFQKFLTYAHKNPNSLQKSLRLFKTSQFFLKSNDKPALHIGLEAAVEVFCGYYREYNNELNTVLKRRDLSQAVTHIMELSQIYEEEFDSCEIVKRVIQEYLDENLQIAISNIYSIDGEVTKALEREECIVIDEDYYFVPEKILRCACKPFQSMFSILSVKKLLYEEGYLCCNNTRTGNFTVKKTFVNTYGGCFRQRVLKIKREFFESHDSLGLQERRNVCTVEALADSHVG